MSLKEVVGAKTYSVWADMLRRLVPDGRTHRLAPLIAGMLQYAADIAAERYGDRPEEGSVAYALLESSEMYDVEEAAELVGDEVRQMFEDAGVAYDRVSSRGDDYSVADSAMYEFVHWYDMPWEA